MKKPVRLINRIKVPVCSPASIAFNEQGVWIADIETGELILLDPYKGDVIDRVKSVVRRPQTISYDGEYLWEYDEETCNLYKRRITDDNCVLIGKIPGVTRPYLGMTCRDKILWIISPDQPEFTVANNQISVIKFPRHIQAETFDAPTYSCRGLCHDGKYLWTLDVVEGEIFALDPETGVILTSYKLPDCEHSSSIIVTQDRVWTLELKRNELLTFDLDRTILYSFSGGRRSDVDINYCFRNTGPGIIKEMEASQSLPKDYIHQRLLTPVKVIPEPDEKLICQWNDKDGTVIVNKIKDLLPGVEQDVTVSFEIETVNLKYHLYPHLTGTLEDVPEEIKKKYLIEEMMKSEDLQLREVVQKAELLFQTGEKEIRNRVEEILQGEKKTFLIARKLYDFVVDKVKYVLPYTSISTKKILSQGKGSCGNHATIFIALCQVAGLPARSIVGFSIWKEDSRLGYLDHEIPEVYLPSYGWVPVDTSRFMSLPVYGTHPLTKFRSFGTLSDRFFVNGFGRDFTSPFARRRHTVERQIKVEGACIPEERFFMRWYSKEILPEWI
ncbi:MAG: transglutaminase-like domain-containing protein [Candidatus Eremiobacterota bacterium]